MGSVSESYSNGPFGLEQRFTVSKPRTDSSMLVLALKLGGSLEPRQVGAQILFRSSSGETVLRSGELAAVDATGRSLPAHMQLRDGVLSLEIDARHARYPLTIDPFIQQGEKLTAGGETETRRVWLQRGPLLRRQHRADRSSRCEQGSRRRVGFHALGLNLDTARTRARSQRRRSAKAPFGLSVALSADGNTALIGDPSANDGTGAAWVFSRSGSSWTQQAVLKLAGSEATEEEDTPGHALFGSGGAVALSADGNTALIAAGYSPDLPGRAPSSSPARARPGHSRPSSSSPGAKRQRKKKSAVAPTSARASPSRPKATPR